MQRWRPVGLAIFKDVVLKGKLHHLSVEQELNVVSNSRQEYRSRWSELVVKIVYFQPFTKYSFGNVG